MAYEVIFENEGRGVVLQFRGAVTGGEIIDAADVMYRQDSDGRLRYQVIDLTAATSLDIGEDQLRAIAFLDKTAAEKNPEQIVALVGSDEIFVGSDKRYAVYTEIWAGFKTEFFETMAQAREWVSVEYPDFTPERVARPRG